MQAAFDSDVPPTERLVLLALADAANDTGRCWPSVPTLMKKTGLSERTVQRSLSELESMGWVSKGLRNGHSTLYVVRNPRQADTPVTLTPPSGWHPTPVTVTPHPRQADTQNHKEPSLNPKRTLSDSPSANADIAACREVLAFLHRMTGRRYREVDANVRMIRAILRKTPMKEVKQTLAYMGDKWGNDPKMAIYLRPKTLFAASNFENYYAEAMAHAD